jgi:hypothetical protein
MDGACQPKGVFEQKVWIISAEHADDPRSNDAGKPRSADDLWRIRVGELRIIYTIEDEILFSSSWSKTATGAMCIEASERALHLTGLSLVNPRSRRSSRSERRRTIGKWQILAPISHLFLVTAPGLPFPPPCPTLAQPQRAADLHGNGDPTLARKR